MKYIVLLGCCLLTLQATSQITNASYLSDFYADHQKSLIIMGENHSSSAGSLIYPQLIRLFNEKNGTHHLLIEFGPSEAYFYTLYMQTGDEKYLGYTINAGFYTDWKKAWRQIYEYSRQLKQPLTISGVDFDRARTMAYACYNIFKQYDNRPASIDSLMEVVKTKEFYATYTIGYPTAKDLEFKASLRKLLKKNSAALQDLLKAEDFKWIKEISDNAANDFNDAREAGLAKNIEQLITTSKDNSFFLLIGRDHAYINPIYDDKDRVARLLKEENGFSTLTGLILCENSQQWNADYDKAITLFEIRDKIPWKYYAQSIYDRGNNDISVIPLDGDLKDLNIYTDYIITVFDKGPVQF